MVAYATVRLFSGSSVDKLREMLYLCTPKSAEDRLHLIIYDKRRDKKNR